MPPDLPRLVVFADDWGRHPSSAQHLVRALLERWRVDWVNTVGTRRPRLSAADLKRAVGKLVEWSRPPKQAGSLPANLTVHAPAHWPGFGARWERALNARLLERALRPLIERADAVVTTAPIVADVAGRTRDANWIYYCVDDLAEWPGLDARALRVLERDLLPHMRRIVAVSEHLRTRLAGLGFPSEVITHGLDPAHWTHVAARPPRERRARPAAVFWGAIDRRLDVEIVMHLAAETNLTLVGPLSDPDPRILSDTRIRRTGPVPYDELPHVAADADVLVMPYADLPVTRAMQPLKLKEYLATGLPTVATPLLANREWADALDLVANPEQFARRVRDRAFLPLPDEQRAARERLAGETWAAKAAAFERCLARKGGA